MHEKHGLQEGPRVVYIVFLMFPIETNALFMMRREVNTNTVMLDDGDRPYEQRRKSYAVGGAPSCALKIQLYIRSIMLQGFGAFRLDVKRTSEKRNPRLVRQTVVMVVCRGTNNAGRFSTLTRI